MTKEKILDAEAAWDRFIQGQSTGTIARSYGVQRITVMRRLRRLHPEEYQATVTQRKGGRPPGRHVGSRWDVLGAFERYKAGETLKALAADFQVTSVAIAWAFRERFGEEYRLLAAEKLKLHRQSLGRRMAHNGLRQRPYDSRLRKPAD